jgi:hypothetical protein
MRPQERSAWAAGSLGGADVRARREDLRVFLDETAARGGDLRAFVAAVAARDPATAADLCLGPKTSGGPAIVRAVLAAIDAIEPAIPPAGLYHRLVDLAPEEGDAVLDVALARHGLSPWMGKLCRRVEDIPGRRWLERALEADEDVIATLDALAAAGLVPALTAYALRHASVEPIASLAQVGAVGEALVLARRLAAEVPQAPVRAALFAWFGPAGPPPR